MFCLVLMYFASSAIPGETLTERYVSGNNTDRVEAYQFLNENDKATLEMCRMVKEAEWDYNSDLTEEKRNKSLEAQRIYAKFEIDTWKNATSFAWKEFKDEPTVYRWFKQLSILGSSALPEDEYSELQSLISDMMDIYSTAKVCDSHPNACNLSLEPDLRNMMANSRSYKKLKHIWKAWRDASGKKVKEKFLRYVQLNNEAALLNGFPDAGALWRDVYESETFQQDLEELWNTVKYFYEHLHAYVRRKLRIKYGCHIRHDGPIPDSLLGNMWSQSWENIYDLVEPYPGKSSVYDSQEFQKKGITVLQMFKMAEEFFTSLGLLPMTRDFWKKSIFEKPKDRNMVCHASAWDICDGKDVRIKMCANTTMEDFKTVHHEMGHVEYFLQYRHQPQIFRAGANPGFHEAVGDALTLSVSTPRHLKSIGLLDDVPKDKEVDINFLMKMALEKIAFLPFGYLIDQWRWKVFSGDIKQNEMNRKWWEMRLKYQGVCPPVKRTEEDFDPGSKYHVVADVPYIRYFVSFIIQFQFHKALCEVAQHKGPLHTCDIYGSKKAGEVFSMVLRQGSSIPWTEAMSIITGGEKTKMDAVALMEYFSPLIKWLENENEKEIVGWKGNNPMSCP